MHVCPGSDGLDSSSCVYICQSVCRSTSHINFVRCLCHGDFWLAPEGLKRRMTEYTQYIWIPNSCGRVTVTDTNTVQYYDKLQAWRCRACTSAAHSDDSEHFMSNFQSGVAFLFTNHEARLCTGTALCPPTSIPRAKNTIGLFASRFFFWRYRSNLSSKRKKNRLR